MENPPISPQFTNRHLLLLIASGLVIWGGVHAVGVWWGGTARDKFAQHNLPAGENFAVTDKIKSPEIIEKTSEPSASAQLKNTHIETVQTQQSAQDAYWRRQYWPIARGLVVVVCTALFLVFWGAMLLLRQPRLPRYRVDYPATSPLPETPP